LLWSLFERVAPENGLLQMAAVCCRLEAEASNLVIRQGSWYPLLMRSGIICIAAALALVGCHAAPTMPPSVPAPRVDAYQPLTHAQQRWVDQTLASLTLRERVGQMVMVWMLGDYTNVDDSTYSQVRGWVERDHVGGVAMSLGTPIEVAAKLNDLQRRSKVPLIVAADLEPGLGRLEGGVFTHYLMDAGGATVFPPQMAIAATGRDEDAYDVGRITAEEGRAVGIHVNFAPVVDVNNNPANPVINTRSFGEDPQRVARLSAAFVRGARDGGEIATAKHFPGHGDTDADSHTSLPVVSASMARLDSTELVPFKGAIDAGAGLVMTAHIALPAVDSSGVPATLSHKIITGLLRDTLHFRGVAITDAMTMEGIGKGYTTEESSVLAVKAGADILLKPSDPTRAIDGVVAAVERGEISRARIDSAARRVLELKARVGLPTQSQVSLTALREIVGSPEHRATAARIARDAITLLRDRDSLVPMRTPGKALVVQYMPETELRAGRIFGVAIRKGRSGVGQTQLAKIGPAVSRDVLDSLGRVADSAGIVVIATYVRRVEGEGRFAAPQAIAAWIDSVAARRPTIVVSFGNPYLLRQFPNVQSYVVTYGVSDDLERSSAAALLGAPISGRVPVSLPGFFARGDGLRRP
jgi:beta-N-acetylhexosaminidase